MPVVEDEGRVETVDDDDPEFVSEVVGSDGCADEFEDVAAAAGPKRLYVFGGRGGADPGRLLLLLLLLALVLSGAIELLRIPLGGNGGGSDFGTKGLLFEVPKKSEDKGGEINGDDALC